MDKTGQYFAFFYTKNSYYENKNKLTNIFYN